MNKKLYYFIVGETSGDQHAALLMKELIAKNKNITFAGVGGSKMEQFNFSSLYPMNKLAVMGFWEVLKKISFFKSVEKNILLDIIKKKPYKIILIDYPGLNLRIAKKLIRFNFDIIYYITPQVWAWKEKRINILKSCVNELIVIFPFEVEYYKNHNMNSSFVGHPFFDEWKPTSKKILRKKLGLDASNPVLTLYPGSRQDEIKKHLQIFIRSAYLIKKEIPNLQIVIGSAPNININEFYYVEDSIIIESQFPRQALECSDIAILASGTATIEAAIFSIPSVVVYKSSFFSWFLACLFLKTNFIAMTNLIAKKEIMPEFIQYKANPIHISKKLIDIYKNKNNYNNILNDLKSVSKKLGKPGASKKAAEIIIGSNDH